MDQDDHLLALPSGFDLDEYQIDRVLGHGGFGITYLAHDTRLGRRVAIKEYFPRDFAGRDTSCRVRPLTVRESGDFDWGLDRFLDEARVLAGLDHPNIVDVLRILERHGTAYMIMRYEDGDDFANVLAKLGRRATEDEVLRVVAPLLDALETVHRVGYLHRDIKPSNIFVRADGSPVLLDFGAARQASPEFSRSMTALATRGYAPFEQYSDHGRRQGAWSDLYALSAVMYRALTGCEPEDSQRRAEAILHGEADPLTDLARLAPDCSQATIRAIAAGMAVKAADRPKSVAAFRALLGDRACADSVTVATEGTTALFSDPVAAAPQADPADAAAVPASGEVAGHPGGKGSRETTEGAAARSGLAVGGGHVWFPVVALSAAATVSAVALVVWLAERAPSLPHPGDAKQNVVARLFDPASGTVADVTGRSGATPNTSAIAPVPPQKPAAEPVPVASLDPEPVRHEPETVNAGEVLRQLKLLGLEVGKTGDLADPRAEQAIAVARIALGQPEQGGLSPTIVDALNRSPPSPVAIAKALTILAERDSAANRPTEAGRLFIESEQISPSADTELALASLAQSIGKVADARNWLQKAANRGIGTPTGAEAQRRLAAMTQPAVSRTSSPPVVAAGRPVQPRLADPSRCVSLRQRLQNGDDRPSGVGPELWSQCGGK